MSAFLGTWAGFYRQGGLGPLAATGRVAIHYFALVSPWLPPAAAFGAVLG